MKKILTILFIVCAFTSQAQNDPYESRRNLGLGLTLGGVAFTTAAILEGGYDYRTIVTTTSTSNTTYVTPPVWRQQPRNIMFVVGISLTITGLFTVINNR